METIEVKIETDLHDMRAWARWRLLNSKFYVFYILSITLIALMILFFNNFDKDISVIVFAVGILIAVLPVVASIGIVDHSWKRIKDINRVLVFENEGIRLINDDNEILHKWSKCKKLIETDKYLFSETIDGRPIFALCKYRLDSNLLDTIKDCLIHQGMTLCQKERRTR